MLFAEILDDTLVIVKDNHEAQKQKSVYETFVNNITKVLELTTATQKHLDAVLFIQKEANLPFLDREILHGLAESISVTIEKAENGDLMDSDVKELQLKIHAFKEQSNQIWINDVAETIKQSNSSLQIMLEIADDKLEINRLKSALTPYENKIPLTLDNAKLCVFALHRSKSLISEMGLDEEIESFMQKISAGNASLFDLSPTVKSWIKERNLESRIKLRL